MGKGFKKPKVRESPSTDKQPRIDEAPSDFYKMTPAWRINRLETVSRWGWYEVPSAIILEVHQKLSDFESMTWGEILVAAKKQNHSIPVEEICKDARRRLDEIGYGDLESLISLRLEGRRRVWGVMNNGALTLLWLDENHEICPSILKHT